MDGNVLNQIDDFLERSVATLQEASQEPGFKKTLFDIAERVTDSLMGGGKAMFAGNGGSAADAQHIAGEFVSRLNFDRAPLAGLALTTDSSVLTAIGNDYGYADVFSRQVAGLGRKSDVFFAISTSGNSLNILKAVQVARDIGITTVGFTGRSGGKLAGFCDICLHAPSDSTPMIQQVHIVAAHIVCGLVENAIFSDLPADRRGVRP